MLTATFFKGLSNNQHCSFWTYCASVVVYLSAELSKYRRVDIRERYFQQLRRTVIENLFSALLNYNVNVRILHQPLKIREQTLHPVIQGHHTVEVLKLEVWSDERLLSRIEYRCFSC